MILLHDAAPKLRRCLFCARLDDAGYSAPVYLQAPMLVLFLLSGFAVSYALSASLGDNTWGVSTGTSVFWSTVPRKVAQYSLPCSSRSCCALGLHGTLLTVGLGCGC